MSKTPQFDQKLKQLLSDTKPGQRICPLTGEKWQLDQEEIGWLKKLAVPASDFSPLARQQIMAGYMIGYQWWWQRHPDTKKPVLTFVHPATKIKVLPDVEWFDRDFSSENQEPDSNRSFFDQFRDLQLKVPLNATRNTEVPENSIAINSFGDINSYFNILNNGSKNSFFCIWTGKNEESAEMHNVEAGQRSVGVDDAARVFNSRYIRDCNNIQNSAFLFLASDLEMCFGAVNRKRKKFMFFDEQLTEGEYKEKISSIDLSSRKEVEKWKVRFDQVMRECVWPAKMSFDDEGSVGEYLYNTRNCKYCFQCVKAARDLYRCSFIAADTFDNAYCICAYDVSNSIGCVDLDVSINCKFCYSCKSCQNLEYCMACYNCENCFGCVGLNRKQFYIFNKEYSEDEYWQLVDQIKCQMLDSGEYGQFFPLAFSPCYFPQSGAALYFGADEAIGKQLGALEFDPESEGAIGDDLIDKSKTRSSKEIPDTAEELDPDEWVGVPIMDEEYGRRFAFLRPEIEFYRKFKIAPPNRHPVYRMQQMIRRANLAVFEEAVCTKCNKSLTVAKNLTFPERNIYCKPCYRKYMEGR